MTTHPSDWRNASSRTKGLAALALFFIIGGVALTSIFSAAASRAVGPTLIARNAVGETLLANPDTLFLVAADEQSSTSLAISELGLRGPVMSVTSDGTGWFIGDDATGMLHRCDLRVRQCTAALQEREGRRAFRRAHKVAFTADRIFMTDSESHRLLVFDRAGQRLLGTRTHTVALCFPNGIIAIDDHLYIADTNNFRIVRIMADDPERSAPLLQTNLGPAIKRPNCTNTSAGITERGTPVLNTALDSANTVKKEARPPARPDRVWPASVLRSSTGDWWVIQMANRMRMGDVIRYSADGRPLSRVDLPPDADPINLLEAGGHILVTDAGLTQIHRVNLQGKVTGEWGPPSLQASLRAIDQDRAWKINLKRMAIGVIAAGVLFAIMVVIAELRRKREQGWTTKGTLAPVTLAPPELGREIVWIPLAEETIRRVRRTVWAIAAYLLAMFVVILYLVRDLDFAKMTRSTAFMFAALAVFLLLIIVVVATNVSRITRRRLGVTRDELLYESGSGSVVRTPWADVRVGAQGLLIGKYEIQLVDLRGRFVYPQPDIEAQVLSRLPPSAYIGNTRLQIEAMRRGNPFVWFVAVAFVLYAAFVLIRIFQPGLLKLLIRE